MDAATLSLGALLIAITVPEWPQTRRQPCGQRRGQPASPGEPTLTPDLSCDLGVAEVGPEPKFCNTETA